MLVLVYGLPKSASSYATELARGLAEAAGHDQVQLRERYHEARFVQDLAELEAVCADLPEDAILVLKTHSPRNRTVAELEERGLLKSIATFRDPRDAALSAFEAGELARQQNDTYQTFYTLESLDDAIDFTIKHFDHAEGWLASDATLKLDYHYLTPSGDQPARDIAAYLGIDPNLASAVEDLTSGNRRVYNYNVGTSGRYVEHFTGEQIERLRAQTEKHAQNAKPT